MKKKIKDLTLILLMILTTSCHTPKIDRIHIISENKCYKLTTDVYYAKYYVYANGNRYRRYDVLVLKENEKCPYCLENEVEVDE